MSRFTPGPWRVIPADKAQSQWIVGDRDGGSIADCEPPGPWISEETADANTRLIAAAPDLLAALIAILEVVKDAKDAPELQGPKHKLLGIQVNNAIAKALGAA